MDDERRPPTRPRSSPPDAYIFAKRLGLIVLAFVLLIPVAKRLGRDLDDQVVAVEGVAAGATTTLAPSPVASSPPDPLAVTTTVFVAATVPPTVAATVPPSAARAPTIEAAAKVTSASRATAKPKQAASTAKKAATKKAAAAAKPKPVVTTAPKRKPAVTVAPKPTPAPAPPPARAYSAAEVESIIRQVWPDALEDHALAIAKRESKLIPTSRNWCCYGLFAIYYEAGKRLLSSIGVTNASQLFDPWVNSRAAVAIYQNAGWDPWKL